MSAFRPLPPKPNLEFEHKEAKALLRSLRAGDAEALARARERHPAIDAAGFQLADAQLVIAREYGFTSWPRLVHYFRDVERQRLSTPPQLHGAGRDMFVGLARRLAANHQARTPAGWRPFAAYVPRFYGMRADEVFAATVTEDDARQATARISGQPTWDALLEYSSRAERKHPQETGEHDPMRDAINAMKTGDLDALKRVIEAHPELLHPPEDWAARGRNLLNFALGQECVQGVEAMRPIMEWLAAQGLDLQRELNAKLCSMFFRGADEVRWLLERGADPNGVAPNGIPVLEHALLSYWNGEIVDIVAERAVPRKALWIAAGLGDVEGVRGFLDAAGKPTAEARELRPAFDAAGRGGMVPMPPDPDDEDILMEAFLVAMLNGRADVLEYMASRGAPVNSLAWGMPMIFVAIGNRMVPMVECLIKCGADLDLRGGQPPESAREFARGWFVNQPEDAQMRRIIELCGMDPDAILKSPVG